MSEPWMIGQYKIGERIAAGGAGEIYAATDTEVGRDVAIKFLRPELKNDPEWEGRFRAEVKVLGKLIHQNIATLYGLLRDDKHLCMIMELVRGQTVEKILHSRGRPLGIKESLAIAVQVADGLSYAHEQGVYHRDIKPSNLLVTESGRVKIIDFGIARVKGSERMTRTGTAIGTLLYMSPEQCKGLEGDERSDIYSLAIVLYELLSGAPPFKAGSDFELSKAHISAPPPPLIPRIAGVDSPLEDAIMKALAKRPEQRFLSMWAFSDAVGASALRGEATGIVYRGVLSAEPGSTDSVSARLPLPTVVLAVVRSRLAAAVRWFRQLHFVPRLGLGAVVALGASAAVVLWLGPEQSTVLEPPILLPPPAAVQPATPPGLSTVNLAPAQKPPPPAAVEPSASPASIPERRPFGDREASTTPSLAPIPRVGQQSPKDQVKIAAAPEPQTTRTRPSDFGSGRVFPENEKPLDFGSFEKERDSHNYGRAFEIATQLDIEGKSDGAYALGLLYHSGNGVGRDDSRAFEEFKKAAISGHSMSQLRLAQLYYWGTGTRKNNGSARHWFEKAAANGVGEAACNLSAMCHKSEGGLTPACEQDWADKAEDLGHTCGR